MKKIGFLILGLLLFVHNHLRANDYVFDRITSNTGITFNAINCIIEDKYGFIWFGSNSGLFYYNSSEITKINFDLTQPDAPQSNIIRSLYKDNKQKLWICSDNGISYFDENSNLFRRLNLTSEEDINKFNATLLYNLNTDNFATIINSRLYTFNLKDLKLEHVEIESQNTSISYFTSDGKGKLYIATGNGLIYKADSLLSDIKMLYQASSRPISTLTFIDDQLWIGYGNNGIEVISQNGERIKVLKSELFGNQHIVNNRVRRIIKGPENEIWIGGTGGITVLNSEGYYDIVPNIQNGLPHDGIFELFMDSNNGVWVGTWSGGLAYYHQLNYKFPHIQSNFIDKTNHNSVISSFSEDEKGTIWVGSENHGLSLFDVDSKTYTKNEDSPIQRIKSIQADKKQRLWFGTLYNGLWIYENNKFKQKINVDGIFSTVLPTKNGTWIGQRGGGAIFYDENQNVMEYYLYDAQDSLVISSNLIWKIFEDSKENIWICSDYGISVRYKNSNHFTNYYKQTSGLSSDMNYTLTEDKMGNIWIGTAGSGIDIYDPKTKTFSKFSLNESIKNADVYCILKDLKGNIWFSSNQGIYAYYHDAQRLKSFTKEDGLLGQQFHPNSGFVNKKGILFFGGGNGFNIIDPEIVQPNMNKSEIFLSKLMVNNQNFNQQKPKFIDSNYLPSVNRLELKYNQNSIALAFVANNFIKNSKSKFRYRMLNYIDEWNETDYNTNISFTKVPPGDYDLQVEYLNNDGLSIAPLKEISIKIYPPFWFSWYAYVIYFLIVFTIVIVAIRELRFREKSRAEHMLFTEKVKFFTNISHEFRTPLTLIISPINNLLRMYANETKTFDNLKIIQRNADRLLRLTNQIMDFRLIELNSVKLKRQKVDVIDLCKNVYDCFEFQINEKEINCIFNSAFKSFELYVDEEKLEKVIYNILSNAVKYSNEKGQIIFSIEQKKLTEESYKNVFSTGNNYIGDVLEIKIKDSGKGIKKGIMNNIFDRFFVDAEHNQTSTGIGLHICQEYMRLHNGNIMVDSEPGKETIFSINIPIESEANFEKESVILQSYFDSSPNGSNRKEEESYQGIKPVILFAEDNNDLRAYYKNLLSSKYKVISAKNGMQAFEIATELIPNVIISDILMPGLDGMSLTEKIRNTTELKHIPIILLTALSENKVKIESMQKGANDFLTKPVDEELLFAKIDNILSNTELVKNKYKEQVTKVFDAQDKELTFIEKVEQIVEKNLQNQSFEITELASQIGVSRSSLQRKIKKTLNMSPSEFIREVRLKKAVTLLKNDEYNIDEIAIIVGFNSTSYFIRSFKKKYEMTPTTFKQNLKT